MAHLLLTPLFLKSLRFFCQALFSYGTIIAPMLKIVEELTSILGLPIVIKVTKSVTNHATKTRLVFVSLP